MTEVRNAGADMLVSMMLKQAEWFIKQGDYNLAIDELTLAAKYSHGTVWSKCMTAIKACREAERQMEARGVER